MKRTLKNFILLGLLTFVGHVGFAQQKGANYTGASPEEMAIQKVLVGSRTAFDNRDLKLFTHYFSKSPALYYQISTINNQVVIAHGWDAMTNMVEAHMQEHPQTNKSKNYLTNLQIQVNGNSAWAHSGGGEQIMSRDFYVLEKQEGTWKIVALTSQEYKQGELIVVK